MTLVNLTDRERTQLEALMVSTPDAKEHGRAQALLWLNAGESVAAVADRLRVSRRTIYYWTDRCCLDSHRPLSERLRDAPRPGRPPTALGIIDPLIAQVIDHDPRIFGYHATSWTAPLLQHYLQEVHQFVVSRKSVSRALDRLHIRWKRPRHQLGLRPEHWRQAKGGSNAAWTGVGARSG